MAKRFTDTNKYKKQFIRSLPGSYKLLWDYLCCECDHAGIWHVDFEIAQIYVGKDMPIDYDTALKLFNEGEERIIVLAGGKKWLIKPFIEFQYGVLNPTVKAHASVLSVLQKEGVGQLFLNSSERVKDKDTDTDMDKREGTGEGYPQGGVDKFGKESTAKKIAKEKATSAFLEFRAAVDKHMQDGVRLVVEDALSRRVMQALGGVPKIRDLIARNGMTLETEFCERYVRLELAEFKKSRGSNAT